MFPPSPETQLYLRVLEAILETESKRIPQAHLKVLLREDFHRALLACSLEVVIASYGLSQMQCPWILNVFNLKPYDFFKVCVCVCVLSLVWHCLSR